jgi:hypothetical protein
MHTNLAAEVCEVKSIELTLLVKHCIYLLFATCNICNSWLQRDILADKCHLIEIVMVQFALYHMELSIYL